MAARVAILAVLALVATVPGPAATLAPATAADGQSAAQARAGKDPYRIPRGVMFNDPTGKPDRSHSIYRTLMRSIRNTHRGEVIRIATWNFVGWRMRRELADAHRRGVGVRLVMQDNMADIQGPDGDFVRLRRILNDRSIDRPRVAKKSWAKTCDSSCRGGAGITHSKVYLFSRVNRDRDISVVTSANATPFISTSQWNDAYVLRNNRRAYRFWVGIFAEMAMDRQQEHPTRRFKLDDTRTAMVFPLKRKKVVFDPVLKRLEDVRCLGARNGAGNAKGRTIIRVAQTAILDARGEAIARRLRELHDRGCDVSVIYAVAKSRVTDVFDAKGPRGPVRHREYTQDLDGDGVYDRYLHMKVLTINGNYAGDRSAWFTWNGSANWTRTAINSDEAAYLILRRGVTMRYQRHIDALIAHPPKSARIRARIDLDSVDPYAKVEIN